MVVASETAELGLPEITVGLSPGGGATQRLARDLGRRRAMELVLTGRRIDASEAARLGLVNQVAGKRDWLERALALAEVVALPPARRRGPGQALRAGGRGDPPGRRPGRGAAPARPDGGRARSTRPRCARWPSAGARRTATERWRAPLPSVLGVVGAGHDGLGNRPARRGGRHRDAAARPGRRRAGEGHRGAGEGPGQAGREGAARRRPRRGGGAGDRRGLAGRPRRMRAGDRGRARARRTSSASCSPSCRRSAARTRCWPRTPPRSRSPRSPAPRHGRRTWWACTSSTRRR